MKKIDIIKPAPPPPRPPKPKKPDPPPTTFEQLLPCTWREIHFPVSAIKVTLSQDLVEHKYWGVDGARVESTGRAPLQIEATIPFVNGIVPGKNEKWGVLYPTEFRKFLDAFADNKTGMLQHPELGGIVCRPVSIDFAHDAQRRDGVEATARWIETVETDVEILFSDSPIKEASLAALDLDASKDDILSLVPDAAFPEMNFDMFVNKIAGAIDQVALTADLLAAKPGQLLNRVQTLQDSLVRAKNVLTWRAEEACERAKSAVHTIEKATGSHTVHGTGPAAEPVRKKIGRYFTKKNSTLAGVLGSLPTKNTTMQDLIKLNVHLMGRPDIPAGSLVRYYE